MKKGETMKKIAMTLMLMAVVSFASGGEDIIISTLPATGELLVLPESPAEWYVYQNSGSRLNHGIPSGWMGDTSDLHMTQRWEEKKGNGKYCIQIKYSGLRTQNQGWSGIYWTNVANNWGDKKGRAYDLRGYKKLKFKARGETGKEVVDKFFFGGLSGTESWDTDSAQTETLALTKDWKTYEIDLKGLDMSAIIAPFAVVFSAESNPDGATIYIDSIEYVK